MPRGRKTTVTVRPTPQERVALERQVRATAGPAGLMRRARMILLLAEGLTITTVAARVGFSRRHVYKWARRFSTDRLVGLRDRRAYATGEEEDGT